MVTLSRMDCEVMSWIVHLSCFAWILWRLLWHMDCVWHFRCCVYVGIANGLLDVWHGLCTRYTTIFWVCCCMDCGLIVWCKSWIVYHGLSEAFWWIVFSWCVMWVARSLSRFLQTMNRNLTFMLCLLLSVSCWLWLTVVCPAWILFCFLKCFMAFVVSWFNYLHETKQNIVEWNRNTIIERIFGH